MTNTRSLLSVRLDPSLAEALDRHCEQTGLTRSHVVQQGVAQYLVHQTGPTLASLADAILPGRSKACGARLIAPFPTAALPRLRP